MPAKQVRSLCFTHNNYAEGDLAKVQEWDAVKYGCVGKETGESETPHLQGYLHFKKKISLKKATDTLQEFFNSRPHCEATKGTPQQAADYCKKQGDYVEWGEPPKMGKRMDLEAAYDAARSDVPMIDVADAHKSAFIRYHRGIERVRQLHNEHEAETWRHVEVIVHTGPTGCGKTRAAMTVEDGERAPYKIQGDQLAWWDGYEGQKTIVIDEYSNNVEITKLLGLLDGYKLRLPIKGGFTYARWTKVHITTNLKREEFHPQAKSEHKEALERRITLWKSYWSFEDNPWLEAARRGTPPQRREAVSASVLGRRRRGGITSAMAEFMSTVHAQDPDQEVWDQIEREEKRARYDEAFGFSDED